VLEHHPCRGVDGHGAPLALPESVAGLVGCRTRATLSAWSSGGKPAEFLPRQRLAVLRKRNTQPEGARMANPPNAAYLDLMLTSPMSSFCLAWASDPLFAEPRWRCSDF
jgi:hypothetical protein